MNRERSWRKSAQPPRHPYRTRDKSYSLQVVSPCRSPLSPRTVSEKSCLRALSFALQLLAPRKFGRARHLIWVDVAGLHFARASISGNDDAIRADAGMHNLESGRPHAFAEQLLAGPERDRKREHAQLVD